MNFYSATLFFRFLKMNFYSRFFIKTLTKIIMKFIFNYNQPSKNANEMSFVQKDENPKKFESYSASKKKNHFINEKENVSRPPLNDRSNNNLSFSSLNFSGNFKQEKK